MLLKIFKERIMNYIKDFQEFIDKSVVNFLAIKSAEEKLIEAGYKRVFEEEVNQVTLGQKFYFKRNDLSLIAFNIGESSKENGYPLHIVASHVDSPCFKIKPHLESSGPFHKIDVEPYGGMIASSWLDRLLSIAGRVTYKKDGKIISSLINIDEDLLMMPNLCIHFNRDINSGYNYNFAVDTQPFASEEEISILDRIAKEVGVSKEDILNHDLYIYNRDKSKVWGINKEYISSPRIDDLECVYASLVAFINSENSDAINVLYLANNEEVGSESSTGADSDFLYTLIKILSNKLEFSLESALNKSFLISADNAHALHPNHPEVYDKVDAPRMNKGIVIKFNASNRYTSDGLSSSLFIEMLNKKKLPYQYFTNRSDIRGGSTLGNILLSHVSLLSVDVGLAQLATHSSYETAGVKDIELAIKSFESFYTSNIVKDKDTYIIK